jgi:hypothetical protein
LGERFPGFKGINDPHEEGGGADTAQVDPNDASRSIFIGPDKKRSFVSFKVVMGCGGACETVSAGVSGEPDGESGKEAPVSTPEAASWSIYKTDDGEHYILGIVDADLEAYRITSPKDFALSCRITLAPDERQKSADLSLRVASIAVNELNAASVGLTRSGLDCGSAAFGYRRERDVQEALTQTLYRPWLLASSRDASPRAGGFEAYPTVLERLEKWSQGGFSERNALRRYKDQLESTINVLAKFYGEKFGWPAPQAMKIAGDALMEAVSRGFSFSTNEPFSVSEAELRKAILNHLP